MKLRLTNFNSNTFEDTDGSCELCMSTGMYDHPIYTFTDSDGGEHVVDGWWGEWGFLYSYDVNVPLFTYWLHDAEFKDIETIMDEDIEYKYLPVDEAWKKFLKDILDSAQYCDNEQELSKSLAWALKGTERNKNAD